MKERLNLTIDGELLEAMKAYAAGKQMSVSELVESYFRGVTKPVVRESILDLVDGLDAPGSGDASDGSRNGVDENHDGGNVNQEGKRKEGKVGDGVKEMPNGDGVEEAKVMHGKRKEVGDGV